MWLTFSAVLFTMLGVMVVCMIVQRATRKKRAKLLQEGQNMLENLQRRGFEMQHEGEVQAASLRTRVDGFTYMGPGEADPGAGTDRGV